MTMQQLSADDLVKQIITHLPTNWFAPTELQRGTLTRGVIEGFGQNDSSVYNQLQQVQNQLSLVDAVGDQVDLIAKDFFGDALHRITGEPDSSYKARIVGRLFTSSCTRQGMSDTIEKTVGSVPQIMESQGLNEYLGGYLGGAYGPADVGYSAYNVAGMFYIKIDPYHAKITIKQAEPGTLYFMTVGQLTAFVNSIKPLSTVMEVQVIGPDSTGGVPIE